MPDVAEIQEKQPPKEARERCGKSQKGISSVQSVGIRFIVFLLTWQFFVSVIQAFSLPPDDNQPVESTPLKQSATDLTSQTTLSGRVLSQDREPIPGVTVSLDGKSATTDATRIFVLRGIIAKPDSQVIVDGRTANTSSRTYSVFVYQTTVVEGKSNWLSYRLYLPVVNKQCGTETAPVQQSQDAINNRTLVQKSKDGKLLKSIGYTFDGMGKRVQRTQIYAYDAQGRLKRIKDSEGRTFRFDYDAEGNCIHETTQLPTGKPVITKYSYDTLNRLITVTTNQLQAGQNTTTYAYDDRDRVTTITRPDGRKSIFTYDTLCRLTRTTHPDGTTTEFTYDACGRVWSIKDPQGRQTSYTYDSAGQVTSVTYLDACVENVNWDATGQGITEKNQPGRITHYEYDALGCVERAGLFTKDAFKVVNDLLALKCSYWRLQQFSPQPLCLALPSLIGLPPPRAVATGKYHASTNQFCLPLHSFFNPHSSSPTVSILNSLLQAVTTERSVAWLVREVCYVIS